MEASPWVGQIFRDATLFSAIDRYLEWRDLIHLMCTCRQFYWHWISEDMPRWRGLASLRALCQRFGLIFWDASKPNGTMGNPIVYIRISACSARIQPNDTLRTVKRCVGGCAGSGAPCNVTHLKYCICCRCAQTKKAVSGVISRALERAGLLSSAQALDYFVQLLRTWMSPIEFYTDRTFILNSRDWYLKHVPDSVDWTHDYFYSKDDIVTAARRLWADLNLDQDEDCLHASRMI